MNKDQWLADVERICEEFAFDKIDHETAMGRLVGMGFNQDEAEKMLREAVA